jgi:hypothetical protein
MVVTSPVIQLGVWFVSRRITVTGETSPKVIPATEIPNIAIRRGLFMLDLEAWFLNKLKLETG